MDPAVPDGSLFTSWNDYGVRQTALFADGSYKFTEQWKLSVGARYYDYASHQDEYSWGYDGPNPTPPANSKITTAKNSGVNPRVNLSYEPGPDLTLYSTVSKGFRPGGANQILPPPTSPPFCQPGALSFGPDSVWNYELGEKARFFDSWLTVNSDVYYIKWNDIQQVLTLPCGYQFYSNAGNGRSFGPELEINAKLSEDWTAALSGAWTDAKLTNPNASYTSFLENVATFPDGVTHPCTAGYKCTVPIMNVVKDTASLSLNYAQHRGQLSGHCARRLFVRGLILRRGVLLRIQAAVLQSRQRARGSRAGRLDGRPVLRQSDQQGRVDYRQQHELPVQHSAGGALFDQPAAHCRCAGQL